jgi:hypothetical protein
MRTRNLVIGVVAAVVVVGAGSWYLFGRGGSGGSAVRAGAGEYTTELSECQEEVLSREMHNPDLAFTPNTTWNQSGTPVHVGGKFTKPGAPGRSASFTYDCSVQGRRVVNVDVR